MARFYNPRRGQEDQPVDYPVGYRGRLQYDPRVDSGSSGGETSDITPERQYSVDLRRLGQDNAETALAADTANDEKQERVQKFLKATRLAGKYQQQQDIQYPIIGNSVPVSTMARNGVQLPSLGDSRGNRGSVNYATKPQPRTGKAYNWVDSFS